MESTSNVLRILLRPLTGRITSLGRKPSLHGSRPTQRQRCAAAEQLNVGHVAM